MSESKTEETVSKWFDKLAGLGTTYLEYDKAVQQAEYNALVNKAAVQASPIVAKANAEAEVNNTKQLIIGFGVVAVAMVVGIGVIKLMKKW